MTVHLAVVALILGGILLGLSRLLFGRKESAITPAMLVPSLIGTIGNAPAAMETPEGVCPGCGGATEKYAPSAWQPDGIERCTGCGIFIARADRLLAFPTCSTQWDRTPEGLWKRKE